MTQFQNLIAGEFQPAVSGQYIPFIDSLSETQIAEIADSEFMDAVRALQAANQAQVLWSKLDRESRMQNLCELLEVLRGRLQDFASAMALDQGASLRLALRACQRALSLAEIHLAQEISNPFAQASNRSSLNPLSEHSVAKDMKSRRESRLEHGSHDGAQAGRSYGKSLSPLGVVAVFTARLDVFETILMRLFPALVAGNMVILKSSSRAPRVTQIFAECLRQMNVRNGGKWTGAWVQVLQGKGEKVGNALVIHPGLHTLSFTGTTATAIRIQTASADSFKRIHYALGARNPVLIFQETEIGEIIPRLMDICIRETGAKRGSRIFVQESVYKDYLEALKTALEKIKLGSPLLPDVDLGPVADMAIRDELKAVVSGAKSERAKLLNTELAAMPTQGYFVQPEALFDLTYCSTIQQEEILGPLLTITSFKYQHDALKHAATSPYGRIGYVFCNDSEKALRVSEKLDVECVLLNPNPAEGLNLDDQSLQSSGLRQSGWGGSGFQEMIRFFSRETVVFGS